METKVVFEDDWILVLDKPSGMTVNKADTTKGEITIQDWVEEYIKIRSTKHEIRNKLEIQNSKTQNSFEFRNSDLEFSRRAGIVHRLDKETSGALLVAKNIESFENLQRQFKERKVEKTYVALVHGKVGPSEGEIAVPVGRLPWNRKRFGVIAEGKQAVTKYRVIGFFEMGSAKWDSDRSKSRSQKIKDSSSRTSHFTLLELQPKTGRTHQIRVHLKYLGHPIVSDPLYSGRKQARNDRKTLSRVFLHASKIGFYHPKTKEFISFESPLPLELEDFLSNLIRF